MRFGKIPSKLVLNCAPEETFAHKCEDVADSVVASRQVKRCFVADAASEDSIASGLEWAKGYTRSQRKTDDAATREESDNAPRHLTVCGVKSRREGGRAWKVVDDDGRLFDLREDVLLDQLIDGGVKNGGRLTGTFVFAQVGSQMRLVRVGSQLHQQMLASETRRKAKNVSESDLIIGGLYASRKGLVLYLGCYDTLHDVLRRGETTVQRSRLVAQHLSMQVPKYQHGDLDNFLRNALSGSFDAHARYSKSVTAVELVRQLPLPADWLAQVQAYQLDWMRRYVSEIEKSAAGRSDEDNRFSRAEAVCIRSRVLNLVTTGKGEPPTATYQECWDKWVTYPLA